MRPILLHSAATLLLDFRATYLRRKDVVVFGIYCGESYITKNPSQHAASCDWSNINEYLLGYPFQVEDAEEN